jgi:hypothetical protein
MFDQPSSSPIELSLNQSFEKERFARAITESTDVEQLRKIAHVLLDGWFTQRAASQWMMRQALNAPVKSKL